MDRSSRRQRSFFHVEWLELDRLDPDAIVASIWPEFAQNGKETITIGHVLSHQAGLPYIDRDLTLADALAWHPAAEALAAQAPRRMN